MQEKYPYTPRVKKTTLLLLAGIIWMIAGYQIFRIGMNAWQSSGSFWLIVPAILIFGLFYFKIFSMMVRRHHKRIMGYEKEKICAFACFDKKGYIIMAIMMSGGILIRVMQLLPTMMIAFFYTGLASALILAGISFLCLYYIQRNAMISQSTKQ